MAEQSDKAFIASQFRTPSLLQSGDLPPWTASTLDGPEEDEITPGSIGRRDSLGMLHSYAMPLGDELWRLNEAVRSRTRLTAGIFALPSGRRAACVRIPRYRHDPALVLEFSQLIRRFERDSDLLIIDQAFNPGGSLFQAYALGSWMTAEPLPVLLHTVKLWEQDLAEAEDLLERAHYADELAEDERPSAELVAWSRFVIEHWRKGRGVLSNKIPLYGKSHIEPAPAPFTKDLFILSNGLTFSAGEFLAAAFKDAGRAVLLGQTTAGAGGCARRILWPVGPTPLPGTLTWTVGWRASGQPIENIGIAPDISIEVCIEDIVDDYAAYRAKIAAAVDR